MLVAILGKVCLGSKLVASDAAVWFIVILF